MVPLLVIMSAALLTININLTKTAQVFKFMLGSVKHELGVNDSSDMIVKKHALLSSWHISVGPYKDYKLVNTAAKHLSGLNYEVKVAANKNNSAYYLLVGSFADYKYAQRLINELRADKYLSGKQIK